MFALAASTFAEPNPPNWDNGSVQIFYPGNDQLTQRNIDVIWGTNGGQGDLPPENGQFTDRRYALMFMPGNYTVDVPVGYYTQVGLGKKPSDVLFTNGKGVYCPEAVLKFEIGSLDNFWRGAENFEVNSTYGWFGGYNGTLWALSQGSSLRRVKVNGDLILYDYHYPDPKAGYASGGYMADVEVLGQTIPGSQQQFFFRNMDVGTWKGGIWNNVFVGVKNAPPKHCGYVEPPSPPAFAEYDLRDGRSFQVPTGRVTDPPAAIAQIVVIDKAPIVSEKPYLIGDNQTGKFSMVIPAVVLKSSGVTWKNKTYDETDVSSTVQEETVVDFTKVYVASNRTDTASSINAKLMSGLNVVLQPGIYNLSIPLTLSSPGQVLLGIGLATLVSGAGKPCIVVKAVAGVRIAGVLLQAGPPIGAVDCDPRLDPKIPCKPAEALLIWGEKGDKGDKSNPGFLHDVHARVGGPTPMYTDIMTNVTTGQVAVDAMVVINAGSVIGDNTWLWRADHTMPCDPKLGCHLTKYSNNPVQNGLIVRGDDVTWYGLAVEHALKDHTLWTGENGCTYFYQCELPYDVNQTNFGDMNYTGYVVTDNVTKHEAHGIGVYHYMRDHVVTVATGIKVPKALESKIEAPFGVYLNGQGIMNHVINDKGKKTEEDIHSKRKKAVLAYVCDGSSPPGPPPPPSV